MILVKISLMKHVIMWAKNEELRASQDTGLSRKKNAVTRKNQVDITQQPAV